MVSTEDRILEAARSLFIRKGYRGATTGEIAAEAGVSEVTLFRKFGSKKNLLKRIMDTSRRRVSSLLEDVLNADREPQEVIYDVISGLTEVIVKEKMDLLFVMLAERELEEHGFEEWELPDSTGEMIYTALENYLSEMAEKGKIKDVDPGVAAELIIGYISHASLSSHFRCHETRLPQKFADILWNGLKP
ncbi:TetR/AcrR family transcriptional regulator [Methanothermobacter sp.]|uniref:TetR/AcrR family transcriptional regulator n=1 Tax=Methanothermobacter sp. TaxID=1884223 RepID=UPI00262BD868|nr:TetR/AcrR family transcriptional regulator [Methanothermobacter sp.]MDI9618910.1 TetR/AcrR family transcriptional regulator [Methanothermobacter sp.]